jgi:hypothetical protein
MNDENPSENAEPPPSSSPPAPASVPNAEQARRTIIAFAPDDLSDGREPGDWGSRYTDKEAVKAIKFEGFYLAAHVAGIPLVLFLVFLFRTGKCSWFDSSYEPVWRAMTAWLGGALGGTLFSAKWLYHAVAKWTWNRDRRLWRLFTPHLSGGLAFAVVLGIASGILRIFDPSAMNSLKATFIVAFLVGYFSDQAIAKLTEVATTLFGATKHSHAPTSKRGTRKGNRA